MELTEVIEQLKAMQTALADLQKIVDDMKPKEVVETLSVSKTLTGQMTATGETLRVLGGRVDDLQRQILVDRATVAGKVIPLSADEIKVTDLVTLSAMIEKLPVTVPMHRRTPESEIVGPTDSAGVIVQFNAIKDPAERAAFFKKHRALIGG